MYLRVVRNVMTCCPTFTTALDGKVKALPAEDRKLLLKSTSHNLGVKPANSGVLVGISVCRPRVLRCKAPTCSSKLFEVLQCAQTLKDSCFYYQDKL